jgi:predicted secreted protein
MATLTGNDGAFFVGSTATAAVRSFSIETTSDTIETTTMGNDTRRYVRGMSSFSGSADIYFEPDEFNFQQAVFNPASSGALVGDAPVTLKAYVKSDASNDIAFTGTCIVTGFTVNSSMDGMVEASISFQGNGALNFSTSGNV